MGGNHVTDDNFGEKLCLGLLPTTINGEIVYCTIVTRATRHHANGSQTLHSFVHFQNLKFCNTFKGD